MARILRKIILTEISAVDRPAVAGALVSIIKRADLDDDGQDFLTLVYEIQKRDGIQDRCDAMSKVARENPEALARFQAGEDRQSVADETRSFQELDAALEELTKCGHGTSPAARALAEAVTIAKKRAGIW